MRVEGGGKTRTFNIQRRTSNFGERIQNSEFRIQEMGIAMNYFWKRRSAPLAPAPNWRLEAAVTGTLGSVPLHRGGRHLCLPVSGGFQPRDPFAGVRVLECAHS